MFLAVKKQPVTSVLVVTLVCINVLFVFLQIHKQTQLVSLSYARQRLQKEQTQLYKQRDDLLHKLYVHQSSKVVKRYANKKLGLQNINVSQIHKIAT